MSSQSQSKHVLDLARELLDDIELGRTDAERLLLKTSRLVRWVGSQEVRDWIQLELRGYNSSDPTSIKYMNLTGRWIDVDKNTAYWGPLAQQEASINAEKAKLVSLRLPDVGGDYANLALHNVTVSMTKSTNAISRISAIRSRVLALLHNVISEIYYEKEFDNLSESIFERYRNEVDILISEHCGDVLEKIPSVMSRLADGDEESISQALGTCRRIIESFADSIFPPSEDSIEIGGNTLKLDAGKHQNRINAYIHQRTASQSRKQRLRQNLGNLFDRVSTGVHSEVTAEEAKSLFLNTYLFLGEVLHLSVASTQ
jgi:hypothetical protein